MGLSAQTGHAIPLDSHVSDEEPDNVTLTKYTWGLDLSGSLHGAGGVGGLLACEETADSAYEGEYWFLHDANGNVVQVIDASTPSSPTLAAHYEYDPYGNTIVVDDVDQSGYADANPFRFSTKWLDEELLDGDPEANQTGAIGETGLYYYGYRYYSPTLGRWINEDPIEEQGGLNLYAFVGNSPIGKVDVLGKFGMGPIGVWCPPGTHWTPLGCMPDDPGGGGGGPGGGGPGGGPGGGGNPPGKIWCCGTKQYNPQNECCCEETEKIFPRGTTCQVKWKGTCTFSNASIIAGGGISHCFLKSEPTAGCKRFSVNTRAYYIGVSAGWPIGNSAFQAEFKGANAPEDFEGFASIGAATAAAGGGTSYTAFFTLGDASAYGDISLVAGVDFSADLYAGYSTVVSSSEIPCKYW